MFHYLFIYFATWRTWTHATSHSQITPMSIISRAIHPGTMFYYFYLDLISTNQGLNNEKLNHSLIKNKNKEWSAFLNFGIFLSSMKHLLMSTSHLLTPIMDSKFYGIFTFYFCRLFLHYQLFPFGVFSICVPRPHLLAILSS